MGKRELIWSGLIDAGSNGKKQYTNDGLIVSGNQVTRFSHNHTHLCSLIQKSSNNHVPGTLQGIQLHFC